MKNTFAMMVLVYCGMIAFGFAESEDRAVAQVEGGSQADIGALIDLPTLNNKIDHLFEDHGEQAFWIKKLHLPNAVVCSLIMEVVCDQWKKGFSVDNEITWQHDNDPDVLVHFEYPKRMNLIEDRIRIQSTGSVVSPWSDDQRLDLTVIDEVGHANDQISCFVLVKYKARNTKQQQSCNVVFCQQYSLQPRTTDAPHKWALLGSSFIAQKTE